MVFLFAQPSRTAPSARAASERSKVIITPLAHSAKASSQSSAQSLGDAVPTVHFRNRAPTPTG